MMVSTPCPVGIANEPVHQNSISYDDCAAYTPGVIVKNVLSAPVIEPDAEPVIECCVVIRPYASNCAEPLPNGSAALVS